MNQFTLASNRTPLPVATISRIEIGDGYEDQIEATITLSVDGREWSGTIWIQPDPINGGYSHCGDADDDWGSLRQWFMDEFEAILTDDDIAGPILAAAKAQ